VTRRPLRVALAVPLLAIGLGTASAVAREGPAEPLCAQAASAYHAGIVVELGDGQVLRRCVGFGTATITALSVLQASGIEYATQTYGSLGAAVCQIDNEPVSYTECLPSSGSYWAFFISRAGGAWTNSSLGVSSATLSNGDDAGFRYDPLAGADPPPVSPAGTCPAVQPTPTPTPQPTPQPTPRPTPKPTPAATTAPGATGSPTTLPPATTGPASVASSGAEPIVTAGPTATGGGIGQPSPATTAAPIADVSRAGAVSSPFVPGLVLAACAVGALLALLGVQGIRRRHQ
jgi:hypothetical protein